MTLKEKIKMRIVNFLYDHKLLGVHEKCWADLVMYGFGLRKWKDVRQAIKCGWCGACMTDEELELLCNEEEW